MKLRLLISGMLTLISVCALNSAPDPDLFDGRFAAGTSDSTTTGDEAAESDGNEEGSTDEGGKSAEDDEGSAENREGSGEDGEEGEGGGESSADATAENTSGAGGKTNGSGKSGNGSSSAETTFPEGVSGRSFEEFEIGVVDEVNGRIDINRSKEFDSQTDSVSKSSNPITQSDAQNSDQNSPQNSSGNQDPYQGKSEADYGTSVPSGL